MIDQILGNLVSAVKGASAAIFLDGDGEFIAQSGETDRDIKFLGAWKEIHLDQIKDITQRLGLGNVRAVLFSHEDGNELLAPVATEYCLLLFLSPYADMKNAMSELTSAIEKLKEDIA